MYIQNNHESYCDNCIAILSRRLTDLDLMVLTILYNTHSFTSLALPQVIEELTKRQKNSKFTKNQAYMTLLKLEALRFLESKRRGQKNCYYISSDGKRAYSFVYSVMAQMKSEK